MSAILDFPFFDSIEVPFTKDGACSDPAAESALRELLGRRSAEGALPTDLFVVSHGWNNDADEARGLYRDFFRCVHAVRQEQGFADLAARRFVVAGVLWPSKKFAEIDPRLVVGGSAGVVPGAADAAVRAQFDTLREALDDPAATAPLEAAQALLPGIQTSVERPAKLADLVRSTLPAASSEGVTPGDASAAFFQLDGPELMRRLATPLAGGPPVSTGSRGGAGDLGPGGAGPIVPVLPPGPPGAAAGLGDVLGGVFGAIAHLLNYSTYYVMKARAGTVGRTGVNALVRQVRAAFPGLRVHLVGHSFGGRLVTAATDGPADPPPVRPETLTLLQAAFSHYGFARHFDGDHDGFFRAVVTGRKVGGPVLVTHSVRDTAVGVAYPIASRLSGVQAAALGDQNDPFGGIGRNGARKTPEAVDGDLLAGGRAYQFTAGPVYNLRADDIIQNHSDVCRPEVARALLAAVASV